MNMNNDQQQGLKGEKRAYQKPQVIQIPLRPDEAVLGHCKSATASGPGGAGACTSHASCFSSGS
jgi:hypothetical protein